MNGIQLKAINTLQECKTDKDFYQYLIHTQNLAFCDFTMKIAQACNRVDASFFSLYEIFSYPEQKDCPRYQYQRQIIENDLIPNIKALYNEFKENSAIHDLHLLHMRRLIELAFNPYFAVHHDVLCEYVHEIFTAYEQNKPQA